MKTLEELTNDLSRWYVFDNWHDFYIKRDGQFADLRDVDSDTLYAHFCKNGEYELHGSFLCLPFVYVKDIIKYLATTDERDWFPPEKKYNIIIGKDWDAKHLTAYYKLDVKNNGGYVSSFTSDCELNNQAYIFTESEIEELKSTLPTNMAKIVELGKVEVEHD